MLQSPLVQDGGSKKTAQNTRILALGDPRYFQCTLNTSLKFVRIMKLRRFRCSPVLLKILASLFNVVGEDLAHTSPYMRANNNSEAVDLLCVRWHGVGKENPTFLTHLFEMSNSL